MVILAETPGAATVTASSITPGVTGFLVTFALALAAWGLFRSMTRHVRKVNRAADARPVAPDAAARPGSSVAATESDSGDQPRPAPPHAGHSAGEATP